MSIVLILEEPNPEDPLDADIAAVYVKDIKGFTATAKQWMKKYC